jgi:hypothetical protein
MAPPAGTPELKAELARIANQIVSNGKGKRPLKSYVRVFYSTFIRLWKGLTLHLFSVSSFSHV